MILGKAKDLLAAITGPRGPEHEVKVYSRQGCTCCDKAMAVLETAGRKHRLKIEVIDVDTDPALVAAHGEHVPVVSVDGKVRFRGQVNPVLLERLLNSQSDEE
ncbi:glutaredoxin family protein [bacterium]|nr:glutaredoxin family protein [bacterium]